MKKKLVLTILGLAATVASSYGQGGIVFNNGPAGGPYVPVVWDASAASSGYTGGVRSTQPAIVTLWYAPTGNALVAGPDVAWNAGFEGQGFYGYYTVQATLIGWTAGSTWDFQLRASGPGGINGQSVVWQENANILNIGGVPAGPPGNSANQIGFTVFVPEPSTFALLGLGALALVNYRRRTA